MSYREWTKGWVTEAEELENGYRHRSILIMALELRSFFTAQYESLTIRIIGAIKFPAFYTGNVNGPFLVIGCGNQHLFEVLCEKLLKRPELITDKRFLNVPLRVENNKQFKEIVEAWLSNLSVNEAVDMILAHGIPAGPIWNLKQLSESEHAASRGMFVDVEHPTAGKMKLNASPIKLSQTPAKIKSAGPVLGQHNAEVLSELGYTQEEIAQLYSCGVV